MRTFKILALLLALFLAIQCSNDSSEVSNVDSENITESYLIGNWKAISVSVNGEIIAKDNSYSDYWGWVFEKYPIPVNSAVLNSDNYIVNFSAKPKDLKTLGDFETSYKANVSDYVNNIELNESINGVSFFEGTSWYANPLEIGVSGNGENNYYLIQEISNNKFVVSKQVQQDVLIKLYTMDVDCLANLTLSVTFQKN